MPEGHDCRRACGLDATIKTLLGMKQLCKSAAICHIRSIKPSGEHWLGESHHDANKCYNGTADILEYPPPIYDGRPPRRSLAERIKSRLRPMFRPANLY